MRGSTLKTIIQKHGYRQIEVARKLNESQQNFSSMLNAEDVRSSLIERISEVLGIPIHEMYGEIVAPTASAAAGGTAVAGSGNTINAQVDKRLDLLKEKDVQVSRFQSEIDSFLEIIKQLSK